MAKKQFKIPLFRTIVIGASMIFGLLLLLATPRPNKAAPSVFDWDVNSWPTGSLTEIYTGIGSPATVFTYTFTGDTSRFTAASPETNQIITGGTNPQENTLFIATDFVTITESVTLTIELSRESANVSFIVMDIDQSALPFVGIDRVAFGGFDSQGSPVIPTLTAADPGCISIVGNEATGLCVVDNHTDNGNVTASYPSPVATLTIVFGEGATTAPDDHGIGLFDINFDPPGPTPTPTNTSTPTSTATDTPTPTDTPTLTPETPTPTDTPTPTQETPTPTDTPTATQETPTPTDTSTPTSTVTITITPSATPDLNYFLYLPAMIKE